MEERKGLLSQRTPNGHTDIATAISPHITKCKRYRYAFWCWESYFWLKI